MSQQSFICFYSCDVKDDAEVFLASLLEILHPIRQIFATRRTTLDNSWAEWRQELGTSSGSALANPADQITYDFIRQAVEQEMVGALYDRGKLLSLSFIRQSLEIVRREVIGEISLEVNSTYVPVDFTISIGEHDIWECLEHEEGFLFGRAFLSFKFWGYSTPIDCPTFRGQVFELAGVRQVQTELEAITGRLTPCFYSKG